MYLGLLILTISLLFITKRSQCLDCFVCHSRQNPDCGDPFPKNGNSSGGIALYECERVKKVGASVVAAANAMGGQLPVSYTPLDGDSYACYKITMGEYAVRGCAKPNFCANMTEVCEVCTSDGCNHAQHISDVPLHLIVFLESLTLFLSSR